MKNSLEIQFEELREEVLNELDFSRQHEDEEILEIIDNVIVHAGRRKCISINDRSRLRIMLFNSLRKLDVLQELIENPEITEIMVNGFENIFYEREGRIFKWEKRISSKEKLEDIIQHIVSNANRIVNESKPIVDARLEDGSRINVVLNPVAINGPILTIRRFPKEPLTINSLIGMESLSEEIASFFELIVTAKYNIFISGGTGSGKTSLLNVLSNYIPRDERVITIEDSAELQINQVENLVRLEARNKNTEGSNDISIRDLIRTSLRMRPDRIIVGEVRGEETLDMLQAMNTGHDGSISTGHGNSPRDMLSRLETMVLMGVELPLEAVKRQIASGIDIIIHLGRLRDKSRKVLEIVEVVGVSGKDYELNSLYKFVETAEENGRIKGEFRKLNNLRNVEKIRNRRNDIGSKEGNRSIKEQVRSGAEVE